MVELDKLGFMVIKPNPYFDGAMDQLILGGNLLVK